MKKIAPAAIILPALLLLSGCDDKLEELLESGGGRPRAERVSGSVPAGEAQVPAGPHLYCITNIGHTLAAFPLTTGLDDEGPAAIIRREVELDPVGPWFSARGGYYLSRVDGSGAGANALIAFDPQTLLETGRLNFPGNSNPAAMLILPDGESAYVALRGSTFDDFATNGLAVIELETLTQSAFLDLNDPANRAGGGVITSLGGLLYHHGCATGWPCVYGVADNWRNQVRQGWLLILEPRGLEAPLLLDAVGLGLNPRETLLLDGEGELWVVNNGGYAEFGGRPGTLQLLDSAAFADGLEDNETVAVLDIGGDPTGIYSVAEGRGWVTSYPDGVMREVNLTENVLVERATALPALTGPLFPVTEPAPALYAGMGGFGAAQLGRIDPDTGELLAVYGLQSGNGPLSCAQHTLP